ncbi:MAG TPA: phosphate ABC transporter permease subunit PstC [Gemmataceae bacterium]|nr:phosphate ABC transporter permease subunit PstC [Gemmataceae bacterium]
MSISTPPPLAAARPTEPRPPARARRNVGDFLFKAVCGSSAGSILALTALLVLFIARASWPALHKFGFGFLTSTAWNKPAEDFGAFPFILGTVITSALAMLIAVPVSVAAATYLAEVAPGWLRRTASFLIELLAAIPSVIYGFWGIFFLVPIILLFYRWAGIPNITGRTVLTASIILAIMIVPYISAITYDVCRAVPQSQRQGALALGATRWQMIRDAVLPYARPGIVAACFLALGRALGETMAVAMLIGNNTEVNWNIFEGGATIPSVIANQFGGADSEMHRSALIALGLVLFLVTVFVNLSARLLLARAGQSPAPSDSLLGRLVAALTPLRLALSLPFKLLGRLLALALEPLLVTVLVNLLVVLLVVTALVNWTARLLRWRVGPFRIPAVPLLAGPFGFEEPPPDAGAAIRQVAASNRERVLWTNRAMTGLLGVALVLTLIPLFHILGYITFRGAGSINWQFFAHLPRDADDGRGLGHALLGSAIMVGLATAAAGPLGILAALYLSEYRKSPLSTVVRFVNEQLLGVPSIIVGIFAYALIAAHYGFSAWAGAFSLAVLMLPIVTRSAEEALKLVPATLRNASYALGASHAQTVVRVLLPTALPTIITGVCLAIARIAGETAPLLLAAGNSQIWPTEGLNAHYPFLTFYIYDYALSSEDWQKPLAWAAALVLLVMVMALNVGIRALTGKRVLSATRAD